MTEEGMPQMKGTWRYESESIMGRWFMSNTPDILADFSYKPQAAPELPQDATCDTCHFQFASTERHVTCWSCFNVCHTKCHVPSAGNGGGFTCRECAKIQAQFPFCPPVHRAWSGSFFMRLDNKKVRVADNLRIKFDFTPVAVAAAGAATLEDGVAPIATCRGDGSNMYGNFSVTGQLFNRPPSASGGGYDIRFTKRFLLGGAGAAAAPAPAVPSRGSTSPPLVLQSQSAPPLQQQPSPSATSPSSAAASVPTLQRTSKAVNLAKLDEDNKRRRMSSASSPPASSLLHSPPPLLAPLPPPAAPPPPPPPPALSMLAYLEQDPPLLPVWVLNHFRPVREWERLTCLASASDLLPVSSIMAVLGQLDLLNDLAARAAVSGACRAMEAVGGSGDASLACSLVPCGTKHSVELVCAAFAAARWPGKTVGVLQLLSSTTPPSLKPNAVPRVTCSMLVDAKATQESATKASAVLLACDLVILSLQTHSEHAAKLVSEAVLAMGKPTVVLLQDLVEANAMLVLAVLAQMQTNMTQVRLPTKLVTSTVLDTKLPLPLPVRGGAGPPPQQQQQQQPGMFAPHAYVKQPPPLISPEFPTSLPSSSQQQTGGGLSRASTLPLPQPAAAPQPPPPQQQQRMPQHQHAYNKPPSTSSSSLPQPIPPSIPTASLPQPVSSSSSSLPQPRPPPTATSSSSSLPQPRPAPLQQQQQPQPPFPHSFTTAANAAAAANMSSSSSSLPQPTMSSSSSSAVRPSAVPPPQTLPRPAPPPQQPPQQQPPQQLLLPQHHRPSLPQPTTAAAASQMPPKQVQGLPMPQQQPLQLLSPPLSRSSSATSSSLPQPVLPSNSNSFQQLPKPPAAAAATVQHQLPQPQYHLPHQLQQQQQHYAGKRARGMDFEVPPLIDVPAPAPVASSSSTSVRAPIVIVDDSPISNKPTPVLPVTTPPLVTAAPAPPPPAPPAPAAAPAPKRETNGWDDDDDDDGEGGGAGGGHKESADYSYLLT